MAAIDITVGGRWLALEHRYGDVEMSTSWPGGCDELAWTPGTTDTYRFTGGEMVVGYLGPAPVWRGRLSEPDPSQEHLIAQGLWRDAENFAALDGSGNATTVPNTAIDQAISRGLVWTRPASLSTSAAAVDITQGPVTLAVLLDAWATEAGKRWGVNAMGEVVAKVDDTTPTWSTLPLDDGLGYTLDGYASTLIGRYLSSSGYATTTPRTNTTAEQQHGHVEATVDLTPRGVITGAKANAILDNLLALTYAVPKWTTGIELAYGEMLTANGTATALEAVTAGTVLRVPSGFDLAWRLQGQMYLDVPIGRTSLSGGLLTLQPLDVAPRNLTDVLTAALTKS